MGLQCLQTSIFIETPSLEGLPTKAKEDPSPHEMRLSPAGHQPSISWSWEIIIIIIIIIILWGLALNYRDTKLATSKGELITSNTKSLSHPHTSLFAPSYIETFVPPPSSHKPPASTYYWRAYLVMCFNFFFLWCFFIKM